MAHRHVRCTSRWSTTAKLRLIALASLFTNIAAQPLLATRDATPQILDEGADLSTCDPCKKGGATHEIAWETTAFLGAPPLIAPPGKYIFQYCDGCPVDSAPVSTKTQEPQEFEAIMPQTAFLVRRNTAASAVGTLQLTTMSSDFELRRRLLQCDASPGRHFKLGYVVRAIYTDLSANGLFVQVNMQALYSTLPRKNSNEGLPLFWPPFEDKKPEKSKATIPRSYRKTSTFLKAGTLSVELLFFLPRPLGRKVPSNENPATSARNHVHGLRDVLRVTCMDNSKRTCDLSALTVTLDVYCVRKFREINMELVIRRFSRVLQPIHTARTLGADKRILALDMFTRHFRTVLPRVLRRAALRKAKKPSPKLLACFKYAMARYGNAAYAHLEGVIPNYLPRIAFQHSEIDEWFSPANFEISQPFAREFGLGEV